MKPKKQLLTMCSALLITALLAACGSPAAAPTATPLPPVPTPIPPTPEPAPVAEPQADAPASIADAPEPIALQPHQPRPDAPPYGQRGPYAVGVRDFVIDTSERQIPVMVWYPASNPEGKPELMEYQLGFPVNGNPSITFAGTALADAQPDLSGAPYPLLVHSHAAWGFPQDSLFLMEHLASHGFVAMAGVHEDNWGTMPENTYRSEISRPKDISHEIDFAEELTAANGDLAGVIDTEHVAVSGGSFGGQVGLEMIGARFNLVEYLRSYCPDWPDDAWCEMYKERMEEMVELAGLDALPEGEWPDWSDPRVDAAVLLEPGAGLLGIPPVKVQRPVLMIEGTEDRPNYGLDGIATERKTSVTLDNAGHFIFANRCTAQPGMAESGFFFVCSDLVWDMDRAHDLIDHFATAFLLAELKGDAEAAAALAPENAVFPGIQYETNAYGAELAAPATIEPVGLRADAPPYAVHGPYAVGTREFTVELNGRTTPITVWYPAVNPSGMTEEITYSMDVGDAGLPPYPVLGHAIRGAEPDLGGAPYPLAVWSHGGYLYRQANVYLAEHLASQGFVVVAGNHEDNWGTFPASNASSIVSRPADISAWIDFAEEQTAAGGKLAGLIDAEHIAAGGHSYGGYTALAVAGALFDPTWYLDVACANNLLAEDDPLNDCANIKRELPELAALAGLDAVPEGLWPSWQDPRVDAIFLLAPSSVFGAEGAAAVTIPALSITGSDDPMQDAALHVYLTHENLASANKNLVVFEKGGHTMFLNDCQSATGMASVAYEWCSDAVWDTDRVHDLTNHFVTAFLLAELKGDAEAAAALAPENVAFPSIRYETTGYGETPAP